MPIGRGENGNFDSSFTLAHNVYLGCPSKVGKRGRLTAPHPINTLEPPIGLQIVLFKHLLLRVGPVTLIVFVSLYIIYYIQ